jgi:hypothetical protein
MPSLRNPVHYAALLSFALGGFLMLSAGLVVQGTTPVSDQGAYAVGVATEVKPNPYNTLAQQLADKEAELAEREELIVSREQALTAAAEPSAVPLYLLGLGVLVLVLIGLNFYWDWRRAEAIFREA